MDKIAAIKSETSQKLAENIMQFARILRDAGLPVGPGTVLDAVDAAQCGAMAKRDDFYWMLHAVFVKRHEHTALFDQAFHVFWRKPKMLQQLMQMFFQQIAMQTPPKDKKAANRRLANAMFDDADVHNQRREEPQAIELEAEFSASSQETLRHKDFEQMTVAEEAAAKQEIARMRAQRLEIKTRRFKPSHSGRRIDLRATIARSVRNGGNVTDIAKKKTIMREPPLVVLCDISGSMSNYSRMFIHFLHALGTDRDRMQVFLFGTRLTNVTRELQRRDVDEALDRVGKAVNDWSGGTRIGEALHEFNFQWARRALTQGAHVLIMTDGLERDDCNLLEVEMARLSRSAKRIIWLNPLLRYDAFAARAAGVKTMMAYVDEFRPIHSLESLADLAQAVSLPVNSALNNPKRWLEPGYEGRMTEG